ncbi:DUF6544 family protein [Methanovulcanius yangii]|uniref:DUF6544 family protein n=1 Tax=Methanovulcanius yangii TaxID=1789227 RepID=UPI0029CA4143|nr:DUF6544 family protein [Methanovulcanius yangii]
MSHLSVVVIIACIIVIVFGIVVALSCISFDRAVDREVADLAAQAEEGEPAALHAGEPTNLPEPVRRYLEYAISGEAESVRFVRMTQEGAFRTDPDGEWMPVKAEQYFSAEPPGFIWHANTRFLFLFWIDVRDRYAGGEGNMLVKALSTIPIADAKGPEMDLSSLQRYIGEMPWFPTAFLNDEYVTWEAIDELHARAIITDGAGSAKVVFSFDEAGRISSVTTDERYRTVGDTYSRDRWTGYFYDYREQDGFTVPMEIVAEWNLPEGDFSYIRLRVTEMEYDVFSRY